MKVSALREWLSRQCEILEKTYNAEQASSLRALANLLAAKDKAGVGQLCDILQTVTPLPSREPCLDRLAELLVVMVEATCIFAKSNDAKDLRRFATVISEKRDHSLEGFLRQASDLLTKRPTRSAAPSGLSEDAFRAYLKRLNDALGDEGFDEIYNNLQSDARLTAADAKKLAKAFVGRSAGSKAAALDLIYGRHKNLITARAAAGSTGRRLAG